MVDKSDPLPPDELGPRLAEVYAVVGPLYRRAARVVEQQTPSTGLSVGVRAVLERLELAGVPETVPQIARNLELSRQFVQRMVNESLERGFVELDTNPAHRRSSLVRLTEPGLAAIRAVQAGEHEAMGAVAGGITGAEVDTTLRVLQQMLTALERREPGQDSS
ncbi:MarR family winged helix-turn-helix transcriptional regulator [Saccharopolyspora griseoalba]|uniref:MarR family winged helix-turn-helix transcriptional regulator n=1 Tax=Saccharopolyspora griseoalba TaxID=1431848 RepID=A0ABW2LNI5_9PSEU